jgi:CheY-specific phosphatase CheX
MVSGLNKIKWLGVSLIIICILALPSLLNTSWNALISSVKHDYEAAVADASDDEDGSVDTDEDDDDFSSPLTVLLDDEVLEYAGLETTRLEQSVWAKELAVQAAVINITPMIESYMALSKHNSAFQLALVEARSAEAEYERVKVMKGSVAQKNIAYAKADWLSKQAQLNTAKTEKENELFLLRQYWGSEIANWVSGETTSFKALLKHEKVLIEVALPSVMSGSDVTIASDINKTNITKATYVSQAGTETLFKQQPSTYFLVDSSNFKAGMRVPAWVTNDDEKRNGFIIPDEAIVWYAGSPWCYIEEEPGTYKRRALEVVEHVHSGYFVDTGFSVDDALVIAGAQMLLSEEFRWQIHGEDDDD